MKPDCLFCQIAHGDKEKIVWENDVAAAFRDLHPKAPTHLLLVPKRHVDNLNQLDDSELGGQLMMAAKELASTLKVTDGYRVVNKTGPHAGMVDHLHLHLMAGKPLDDYPR